MNLTNEERLKIAKENELPVTLAFGNGYTIHFTDEFLATCAAIEKEVENRVREECAVIADSFYQHIRQYTTAVPDIGSAIRGGAK